MQVLACSKNIPLVGIYVGIIYVEIYVGIYVVSLEIEQKAEWNGT